MTCVLEDRWKLVVAEWPDHLPVNRRMFHPRQRELGRLYPHSRVQM
jgi:hypothetical protein